jgi:hypothetical protein
LNAFGASTGLAVGDLVLTNKEITKFEEELHGRVLFNVRTLTSKGRVDLRGEGKSLFEAATFANAAGAIAATRLGAQPSAPNRADIDAMVAGAYHSTEGLAA